MALKQFHTQIGLKRVDMTDHSRVVNAQDIRSARYRTQTRHLIGCPNFIPIIHRVNTLCEI